MTILTPTAAVGAVPEDALEDAPNTHEYVSSSLLQSLKHHYDFRLAVRLTKKPMSTWIDTDDSGTYDPGCQKGMALLRKRSREGVGKDVDGSRELRSNPWKQQSIVASFDEGEAATAAHVASTSADQTKGHRSSCEELLGVVASPYHAPFDIPLYSTRTRRRSTRILAKSLDSTTSPLSSSVLDLFGLPSTRPEPKGCKACFNLGISCPLLEDGSTFPCGNCVESNCDCRLVMSPAKKGACEGCRQVRERCSYREGSDSNLPCENCQRRNQECVANSEKSSALKLTLERPFISCNPCRKARRRCSLRARTTGFPCKNCLRGGIECRFEGPEARKSRTARQEAEGQAAEEPRDVEESRDIEMPDVPKEHTIKNIKTSFAHPLTFNHIPNEQGSDPCHWCDAAAFGIMGNGEVEVTVTDQHDGRGYTEVSGGHIAQGLEPTRMCDICTMERIITTSCPAHTMHTIPGRHPRTFDFEAALNQLLLGSQNHNHNSSWCSICPSPAFFECRTPQLHLDLPSTDATPALPGCGLLLCETCHHLLAARYAGDLQALIADARLDDGVVFPAGLRADVGLLALDGELMVRLMAEEAGRESG
ncbi:MAG: hypothetical protein M1839_008931 [Geoglossum umbratile]|nr:MAG: hypothetical protein M1839_008931 [Geoglossum umbratile]